LGLAAADGRVYNHKDDEVRRASLLRAAVKRRVEDCMGSVPFRVLVVEDDPEYAALVRLELNRPSPGEEPYDARVASSLAEALSALAAEPFDAALADLKLPDASGLDAVRALLAARPGLPLVVATGHGGEPVALEAMRLGAQDFLDKSAGAGLLRRALRYAIERKNADAQCARYRSEIDERRRIEELKDRWLGMLTHDLRNPLTIIKGAVIELDEGRAGRLNGDQAELAGLARRQTERVERLVVRLLDLTRLESGRARAACRALDGAALVRRVASDFARAAAERGLSVGVEIAPDAGEVYADAELLEQLVVNLVDNALRFARARVVVRLGAESAGFHELSVSDDGVGIPRDRMDLLFTRFGQLERARGGGGYKGTGLGLAICKEIADLHRGRIEADTEPGRGTVFLVRLPRDGAKTPPPLAMLRGSAPRP
jgi:signal transduction histidine kinase